MNKHWEEFQTIYSLLNEEAKAFIDSDQIPNLAQEIIEKESLNSESTKLIIIAITNYYLRIVPEYKLPEELVDSGINEEKVLDITKAITSKLKPIDKSVVESKKKNDSVNREAGSDENPIIPVANKPVTKRVIPQVEEVEQPRQTNPTLMTKQREDLLKEIEEAEEKLASISPIRTMQTDYQQTKENGEPTKTETERGVERPISTETVSSSSSQEELLNKKKNQYADLRPQASDDLKWGSDNS